MSYALIQPMVGKSRKSWIFALVVAAGCIGITLAAAIGWRAVAAARPEEPDAREAIAAIEVPVCQRVVQTRKAQAVTDRGHAVRLYYVVDANALPTLAHEQDEDEANSRVSQLIRTSPPDETTNCFGWVFTSGAYWIYATDVVRILIDNGYEMVSVPQVDDLIIYRDADGEITHCGKVRMYTDEGMVLVESKWAWLGRFLHRPEDSPYGSHISFYRSSRATHQLTIRNISPAKQVQGSREPAEPEHVPRAPEKSPERLIRG